MIPIALHRSYKIKDNLFFVLVGVVGFYYILTAVSNYVLLSDDILYNFFGDQFNEDRIAEILTEGEKWKWISYAALPFILLTKFFFVAICISIGALVVGVDDVFKKSFQSAVNAETIFFAVPIIKLVWFSLYQTNYDLEELQYFSPLSALSLFNSGDIEVWLIYPLHLLNVFELLYWLALAYQLKDFMKMSFETTLGFVAASYGIGLLIWVVVVMFLTINIS